MLITKIPYRLDSTSYYEQIRHLDWPIFFDSCYQSDREKSPYARYDIISVDPFIKITSDLNSIKISKKNKIFYTNEDGLQVVERYINKYSKLLKFLNHTILNHIDKNIYFYFGKFIINLKV